MVRAFRQSRLTAAGIFAASVVLTVLVWIRDRGLPVHIPLIASVLMLLLGVFAGQLAARLVADSCNTKLLGLLHVELDPDAFLRQYAAIPGRLKPDSREYLVSSAYLADGYAAKGDFDAALAALAPLERAGLAQDAALRGLYLQDLCAYRLGKEDRPGAAQALEELEGLIAGCGEKQARLAQNLSDCAALLREGVGALRLVAPSLTSAVCRECGPAELAVLEGHTATLGRALVEENFLLVWRSLTVFYLETAKLARNRMVEKLLADICALIPENRDGAGLPRIRRDALQNFFTAHVGLLHGLRSRNSTQTAQLARDSLEELRRFLDASFAGRKSDDSPSGRGRQ